MSQKEIIDTLKKTNRPLGIKELLIILPYNRATISRCCRVLRKNNEVKYKMEKLKRRSKFVYYI